MKWILLLCALLLTINSYAAKNKTDTYYGAKNNISIGYRQDKLSWNIAPTLNENTIPNIISELTWNNLQQLQIYDQLSYTFKNGNYIAASISYGHILSGSNQDSDYAGYDRTSEFSRSNNNAGKGYTLDSTIYLGYDFVLDPNTKRFHFIPVVGYGYDSQHLQMYDGNQTLSVPPHQTLPLGPFPGLDSRFDSIWQGPLVGTKINIALSQRWLINTAFEYHWVWYNATANWNLIQTFQHPVSFSQQADGSGMVLNFGTSYKIDKHWQVDVLLGYQTWSTKAGVQIFHLVNTFDHAQRLNQVLWSSFNAMVGASIYF